MSRAAKRCCLIIGGFIVVGLFQSPTAVMASEPATSMSSLALRAYPGGRDESDLTVQPKKTIARKSEDIDLEQFESESTEITTPQSEDSFGE